MDNVYEYSPLGGEWILKEKLGSGTNGSVYRAEKYSGNSVSYCAIKHISIPSENMDESELIASGVVKDRYSLPAFYDELLTHFNNEINICKKLQGHENIVSYEGSYIFRKGSGVGYDIFIRMELLNNISEINPLQNWRERDVLDLSIDMCRALEILKQHNIIHRDIKPSNIMVSKNGKYKLGDFGEARIVSGFTNTMTIRGSYPYMSPEIFHSAKGVDMRADIYSLGMVMYRMLNNNRPPFVNPYTQTVTYDEIEESDQKRFRGETLNPPCMCTNEFLLHAIMKAVSFRPEDRWTSPEEFKNILTTIRDTLPPDEKTPFAPPIARNRTINGGQTYGNIPPAANIPANNYNANYTLNNSTPNGSPANNSQYNNIPANNMPNTPQNNNGGPQPHKVNKVPIIIAAVGSAVVIAGLGIVLAVILGMNSSGGGSYIDYSYYENESSVESSYRYSFPESSGSFSTPESSPPSHEPSYAPISTPSESSAEGSAESSMEESKTQKVRIVSYRNISYVIAEQKLRQLGLNVDFAYTYTYDSNAGIVTDQSISPGTEVEPGTNITLTVSRGPDFSDVLRKNQYCTQVIDVRKSGSAATMKLYNLTDDGWVVMYECRATVGENGIGSNYGEGKHVTPKGCYRIGVVLSERPQKGNLEWYTTNSDTVIVEDVNSPYYNQIKQKSSLPKNTDCDKIGERLHNGTQSYSIFIEHNGNGFSSSGVVRGDASSITICGCNNPIKATYGCIDISTADMEGILRYMDKSRIPYIRTTG